MSMDTVLSTIEAASSIALAVSLPLWLVVEEFMHRRAASRRATFVPGERPAEAPPRCAVTPAGEPTREAPHRVHAAFSRAQVM